MEVWNGGRVVSRQRIFEKEWPALPSKIRIEACPLELGSCRPLVIDQVHNQIVCLVVTFL